MFKNLLHSPLFKTAGVTLLGAVGPAVLSAFDHPTGGFAAALATNPAYAGAYALTSYAVHNYWSNLQLKDVASK